MSVARLPPVDLSNRFGALPIEEMSASDDDDMSIATTSDHSIVLNEPCANVTTRNQSRNGKPLSIDYSNWRADAKQPAKAYSQEYLQKVAEIDAKIRARIRQDPPDSPPPSNAVPPRKQPLVAVVGDSILKRMSSFELRKRIQSASPIVRPFIGATIEEMRDYIKPVLMKKPDVVVLHIGTNDLSNPRFEEEASILQRFDNLIQEILECGAIPIVSFVVCTQDLEINERVKNYNKLLFDYCAKNLIIFIKHDNIYFKHTMRDGIHLNMHGSDILWNNIVDMINYAIPLCFGN